MENKRPTGLIVVGFLVVLALIIAGLFLPPISLGERLGLTGGGETAETAVSAPATDASETSNEETAVAEATTAIPGAVALSLSSGSATVSAGGETGSAPANVAFQSQVYAIAYEGAAPTGQVALNVPTGSDGSKLDMMGWDGSSWHFMPSQYDASSQQRVSVAAPLPQSVALVQANAPVSPAIAAALPSEAEVASEVGAELTEVMVGPLHLLPDGTLDGEVTAVSGWPNQYLHVTNVGAVVDQAAVSNLLGDANMQASHINDLVARASGGGFAGVNLDYQGVDGGQKDAFTAFANNLATALDGQNLSLVVTLGTPTLTGSSWDSGGQDWVALGQAADAVNMKLPADPLAYGDGGNAEQLIVWATGQVERSKLNALLNAGAVDRIGEAFVEMDNQTALASLGTLEFVSGSEEVDVASPIEVALSGTATPLEWDGGALTYKYGYDDNGQSHNVWLGNEAALSYRARLASLYNLRGITVDGLANAGAGYATAFASYLGQAEAPQPAGAAIVWTVRDEADSVLASASGSDLTFSWDGSENPGSYSVNAEFALGDTVLPLDSLPVAVVDLTAVAAEETPAEQAEAPAEEQPTNTDTAAAPTAGSGKATVNVGSNVRTGPGLGYGTIAGGVEGGLQVTVIGRNSDSSWLNIIMPDGATEGWIFASLVTVDPALNVSGLPVVEVAPPAPPATAGAGSGSGSSSGSSGTTPPPAPAPIANTGFELGGQTHTLANPTLMAYAGMKWVKFQHKWGSGDTAEAVKGRIDQAHGNGFKVLLSIPGADHSSIDYNAYVNFLSGVAKLGPDAIEIWNEMNIDREWPNGQISPTTYVNNMLKPAYQAIKAANPNVMVISGAPAPTGFFGGCGGGGCDDGPYMAGMAAAGAANYMDCIGIHYNEGIISPNQTSGDPRTEHYTRYFWGMVNTYSNAFGGSRPLCFTELGYLTGQDYGGLPAGFAWAGNTTIAQHAQWLAEAASLAAGSGKVRMMIVFNVDFVTFNSDPQAGFAMIRKDGSCPACETLRAVTGGR